MSPAPSRTAALRVLRRVRSRSAYAHEVLAAELRRARLSQDDAALATRLAYGTLAAEGTLDEAIDRFLDRPASVEPQVRDALRLSAYEVLFLRTPARAAVHEGVGLVTGIRPQASGLANAVLRRLSEAAAEFPWGDPSVDDAALARLHAHPFWLAELLISELGRERAADVMAANNLPAPLYLAVNPFRGTPEAALSALEADGAQPTACALDGCIEAGVPSRAVAGEALSEGLVVVSDAASQLVPAVVGAWPGGVVVDAAAGRGTKTLLLQAQTFPGTPAGIVAVDVHEHKARVLLERMTSLGVPGITAVTADSTILASVAGVPGPGTADAVLLDAPCSGLGTLRRHPEKRWRLHPEDPARLGLLAARMLESSARLVRVGGLVVYSTCTLTRAENEHVIDAFLGCDAGRGFEAGSVGERIPDAWRRFVSNGRFQSIPEAGGPDGHFIATLRRVA